MVDLGGPLAVRTRQIEIVIGLIDGGIEVLQAPSHRCFAKPALEGGRAEDFEDDNERHQDGQDRPIVKERPGEGFEQGAGVERHGWDVRPIQ